MVKILDKLKSKFENKKEEKLGEVPQLEKVDTTLGEPISDGLVTLEERAKYDKTIQPDVRATVINLDKSMPTEQSLNLTKKEQPNPESITINLDKNVFTAQQTEKLDDIVVPPVVKNTGAFTQSTVETLTPPVIPVTQTTQIKDVRKPWISKEVISKWILFVTFTAICVDGLMYLYDIGIGGLLILVVVTAIIQFFLVAEYRKPTMR